MLHTGSRWRCHGGYACHTSAHTGRFPPDKTLTPLAMKCKYLDDEGDLCTLNKLTLAHWVQQHPNGPLKIQVSLATLEEAARHIEEKRPASRMRWRRTTWTATRARAWGQ